MATHAGKKRVICQDLTYTSKIREFLRMNLLKIIGSNVIDDSEKFVEDLQKVFEVMCIVDVERVKLFLFQLKGFSRI